MIRRAYIDRKLGDWMKTQLSVQPPTIKQTVPDSNACLGLRDLIIDLSETASLLLCQTHNISFVTHTETLQLQPLD